MNTRSGLLTAIALLVVAGSADAQRPAAPNLTRQQRAALQAVITAVDQARSQPDTPGIEWSVHRLRASDGSHYVAFSLSNPPGLDVNRPVTMYLRLTTRRDAATERSAVAEWLAGSRGTPIPPRRGIAFGEMPAFGAGSASGRDPSTSTRGVGPQSLTLLEMERERMRERREAEERERKAKLEGAPPRMPSVLLPFEDFDVMAQATADKSGVPMLRRSLTTGPGEYDLLVGWVDPSSKDLAASVHVVKRALDLPVASTTEFALSSVILADEVGVRESPFAAEEQTAHPYSIGTTEITPARDHVLTNDERLALIVQVINARASVAGKPDVAVGFRLFRTTTAGQESVGTLSPQLYNQATLPADFDVAKGHPIFAAVAVPLRTFKRGSYRIEVLADDKLAGVSTTTDATFTVIGTPAALLRDAPSVGQSFRRDSVLEPAMLDAVAAGLRPTVPSSTLASAVDAFRARRFVDLVRDDTVPADDQAARMTLRAFALYALGDTPTAVALLLRQVLQMPAPPAAAHVLHGATRALEANDRDAMTAWDAAMKAGFRSEPMAPLLIDAYLRLGDPSRASEIATTALQSRTTDAVLTRRLAAAHIAAGREADALALLERRLAAQADDVDAQWLMLHALFSGFVKGQGPGADAAGHTRIKELAKQYIQAGGKHSTLAAEWDAAVP